MKSARTIYVTATLAVCLCALMALSSCNARKKNTAAARQYTAFITRYNIYYNGDKHYKETLDEMEKKYEDDYTGLVLTHPAEARLNEKAPQPEGNFDRSIEKAQKAIQIRSITKKPPKQRGKSNDPAYKAWMKRDEYNPFLHNAWLMMGRSQYMNSDFLGAAATFFYTSRHFSWLPRTVTEAKLWQARSYLALGWMFEAEQILTRIKPDELTNSTLTGLYNLDYAEYYIKQKEYDKAIPYLEQASRHGSSSQKTRLTFLLGQVYERSGRDADAYKAFGRAAGSNSAPYRTKFNARIKQSEVYSGQNIEPEVKALRRMTRYDRNKEYLDQIYYAIGNLYLSRRDTAKAIENYILAAEKSTRNGIDKAISQITLGTLYYDRRQYELAQPCYAEAVPQLPADYPGIDTLKRRSDVLDELAIYSTNVNLQDSLLRLAAMDSVQRMAVIDKIINDLKKKEKEEAEAARREEYLAQQNAQGSQLQNNAKDPTQFVMNTDNSWYFYNSAARNAGRTEFQRRWGSRKLEDNWRRRNKSTFDTADFDSGNSDTDENPTDTVVTDNDGKELTNEQREALMRADDPHYAEYYLKQIPFTDEQKQTAHDVIQEGLYNMAVILKDKLEDYGAATTIFDRLLRDYPDNVYRLDTYYNLYLMFIRSNNVTMANRYRAMILNDFPDSKYGMALRNPNYIESLRNMEKEQNRLYEDAYEAYMSNDNSRVHAVYDKVAADYPLSKLMPKFMFLHALAFVTERNSEQFNATLRTLLERYPDTDLTPLASAWLKGMAQGRELQSGSGVNMRGMLWDIALSNDSTAVDGRHDIAFTLSPDDRQLLVFVFPADRVSSNQLLYEIARHNFRSYQVKDFDIEQLNFGRLGMLVVRDFDNIDELNHYRRVMAASETFRMPDNVRAVPISAPNFDALLRGGGSLDDYFRFLDEQNYIDAQRDLLPYTETETLEEAEEREADVRDNPAEYPVEQPAGTPEENQRESKPVEPTPESQPVEQPARQPEPAQNTTAKPDRQQKPAQKAATKPKTETKPVPAPVKRPEYNPGSEGDDPLFD